MFALNLFRSGQIRDGAGDFQDAVISARAEVKLRDGHFQDVLGIFFQLTELTHILCAHGGIAMDFPQSLESFLLDVAGGDDPFADFR